MGLDELKAEIRKSSDLEISQIEKEKEQKLSEIRSEVEEESEKRVKKIIAQGSADADVAYKKIIAQARLESKNRIEQRKSEIMDDVFRDVKDEILKLGDSDKRKILETIIKDSNPGSEDLRILVDRKYSGLLKDAESTDMGGEFGVILEAKDGSFRIDATIDSVLRRIREQYTPEIAGVLFS